jgi:nucleoid DNA-binding protein
MKLKELNEAIATKCNVRAQVVSAVQAETFRQVQSALEKGEKVTIPEFGTFAVKDVAGEEGTPGRKVIRFKSKAGEKRDPVRAAERKAQREKKKAENKTEKAGEDA